MFIHSHTTRAGPYHASVPSTCANVQTPVQVKSKRGPAVGRHGVEGVLPLRMLLDEVGDDLELRVGGPVHQHVATRVLAAHSFRPHIRMCAVLPSFPLSI